MPLPWWVPQKCLNAAFFRTSENPVFANWFVSLTSHFCCWCCWRQILLGCFRASYLYWFEDTRVRPSNRVRAGSWDKDGMLICFPGPSLYALQTRKPLSSNWTFLIWLMPSIFANGSQDTSTHSHKETFAAGTPQHERIASLICTGLSISLPALRWILMCDLIVASFRSHAALPPCGLEKSRRLILTCIGCFHFVARLTDNNSSSKNSSKSVQFFSGIFSFAQSNFQSCSKVLKDHSEMTGLLIEISLPDPFYQSLLSHKV